MSQRRRISVQIGGAAIDGGAPTLTEFLRQLEAIRVALKHTERVLTGDDEPDVYFRIVGLSMASPATVVLEETAVRVDGRPARLPKVPIAHRLISTLSQISKRGTVPATARDLLALESYRNVGSAARQGPITITSAKHAVAITPEFDKKVDKIIGPDEVFEGSVTGVLLAIHLHNTTRFEIYPPVGPTKVACTFPPPLRARVIEGIDRNVASRWKAPVQALGRVPPRDHRRRDRSVPGTGCAPDIGEPLRRDARTGRTYRCPVDNSANTGMLAFSSLG